MTGGGVEGPGGGGDTGAGADAAFERLAAAAFRAEGGPRTPDCPDADALAGLLEGATSDRGASRGASRRLLRHVLACPYCRREFAEISDALRVSGADLLGDIKSLGDARPLGGESAVLPRPVAPVQAGDGGGGLLPAGRRQGGRFRWLLPIGSSVAAAAAAVALFAYLQTGHGADHPRSPSEGVEPVGLSVQVPPAATPAAPVTRRHPSSTERPRTPAPGGEKRETARSAPGEMATPGLAPRQPRGAGAADPLPRDGGSPAGHAPPASLATVTDAVRRWRLLLEPSSTPGNSQGGTRAAAERTATAGGQQTDAAPVPDGGIRAREPCGTAVEGERPRFAWAVVPSVQGDRDTRASSSSSSSSASTRFRVVLCRCGADGSVVAPERPALVGPFVNGLSWTPGGGEPRLAPGGLYEWRVEGRGPDGKSTRSAPARFRVVTGAEAASVAAARRSGDPVRLGVACARAGLFDEAEAALARASSRRARTRAFLAAVRRERPRAGAAAAAENPADAAAAEPGGGVAR